MEAQAATEPRTHSDYTVGWVCALPKEQTAATAMLDRRHGDLPKPPNDHNTYTLGSIGNHNIVIACLPKGEIGTNSAATVATSMANAFPSIKIGLMVGIGGGIPPKVRLGDVVISSPVGQYPGVVQWDLGKAKEGGKFERTGSLNNPPASLRTALTKLETEHEMSGSKIPQYLEDLKDKWPNLAPKYTSCDHLKDPLDVLDNPVRSLRGRIIFLVLLWETILAILRVFLGCWALASMGSGAEQVAGTTVNTAVDRDGGKLRNMRVHYGLIASGNQVIQDATFRDRLDEEFGGHVLCAEMEAAGLMNNFPCIVIRGICDYADSHKNEDWQEHAAAVAAAFAKELLQYVQPSAVVGERPVKDILEQTLKKVHKETSATREDVTQIKSKLGKVEDKEVLDWLTKIDYGPQQSDYLKRRQPGTGQWLLDSEKFKGWLSASNQTLFCPGIPGAGKTILTSVVVDHLGSKFHNDPKIGIAYIYFNFQRQDKQKIDDLLASVLKQIAESQPSVPGSVKDLFDKHKAKRTRPLLDETLRVLQSVAATCSRVFIVVDALDECQTSESCRKRFLSELFNLQKMHGINIFATSRSVTEIVDRFKTSISLEIRASTADVALYLEGHISQLPSFVQQDRRLREEITAGISEAVDGMFLLAQIYLNLLYDKMTPNDIRSTLEVFRNKGQGRAEIQKVGALTSAYNQAMMRIVGQMPGCKKLAMEVLTWITCAKRQLTTLELQHALATKPGKSELDDGDLPCIGDMVSVCAGLVTVDENSGIIRLVHYTTKEYLEGTRPGWNPNAELAITTTCVTYLSFTVFETGFCTTYRKFEERLQSNPLYDYAARNWGHHARKAATSSQVVIDFLESKAKVEASTEALMATNWDRFYPGYAPEVPRNMTGLHLSAYFGVIEAADDLLRSRPGPDLKDAWRRTPLWYAAQNGHEAVVKKLLATGADVNATTGTSGDQTALQAAAGGGHLEVVEKLLAAGADINATSAGGGHLKVVEKLLAAGADVNAAAATSGGKTALQAAAGGGHLEVVEKLLAAGADVNAAAATSGGQTALQAAAGGGHLEVVEKLLAAGADVNAAAATSGGQTALQAAAGGGHLKVVEKLLVAGADVNAAAATSGGKTALQAAAGGGHLKVVEKLLAAGADVNAAAATSGGQTALQAAAGGGHLEVVEKLLEAGADVNAAAATFCGKTALQAAAREGHLEVVEKLLAVGADVNAAAATTFGQTALQAAAGGGHLEVVEKLLAAGADVNAAAATSGGQTALQAAAGGGHLKVVEKLLAAGADINASIDGQTALQVAAGEGYLEVVEKLLVAGADINAAAATSGGKTAIQAAARGGYLEVVEKLLAVGADVNAAAATTFGRTALQAAAGEGHLEVVEKLLVAGADVNAAAATTFGQTALQAAARGGHLKVVEKLLAAGADINATSAGADINTTSGGHTALQAAAGGGHLKVVEKLLVAGADINTAAASIDGQTALQAAAGGGHLKVVEKLLAAGADVNAAAATSGGQTALQAAAGGGHLEVVEKLLAAGADVNAAAASIDGQTALQAAARGGHLEVANRLKAAGTLR
ncbi:hypothetical protein QC762_0084380 [Podospora pseudocomata]|uniref:NACHT domain-containing protein n=1 Tax=Podospora pseudocomata TaxID=2093779 RepID=A0ABR0GD20_9PEZI|nr:hypothetical protein QC762_0084380 [Podospora pseudocomata]